MTWKEWEIRLLESLQTLSLEERAKIAEYYQEMYGDKLDAGLSEAEIIKEFGDPCLCAEKILSENATEKQEQSPPPAPPAKREKAPVSSIIGTVFFTLLVMLPVGAIAVSIVITLGAIALSGAVISLAGIVYTCAAPFGGMSGSGTLAHMGIGIAASGIGLLLAIGFSLATYYSVLGCRKAIIAIYAWRKQQ